MYRLTPADKSRVGNALKSGIPNAQTTEEGEFLSAALEKLTLLD